MNRVGVVTAVVLSWRDVERTKKCVGTLLESSDVARVIVVENERAGSELEAVLSGVSDERLLYVGEDRNLGFSAGVNVGLRHFMEGEAPLCLVINNDAALSPDNLRRLIETADSAGPRAVVAPQIEDAHGDVQSPVEGLNPWSFGIGSHTISRTPFLTWACVLVPKEVFRDVGFLDERFFMYWEDVEFGRRLRLRGIPIVEDRRAFVVHEISASHSKASYRIDAYSALGAVVYARIAGRGNLLGVCLRIGARVLRRLASCEFRRALAVLEGTILGMRVRGSAADVVEAWNGRQR